MTSSLLNRVNCTQPIQYLPSNYKAPENIFRYFQIVFLFHFWFFFLVSFDLYPQNISGCTPTGLMSKLSLPIPNEASQLYQPINAQWMEIEILQLQMKQIAFIFILKTFCSEPILKLWNNSKNSHFFAIWEICSKRLPIYPGYP